MKIVNKYLLLKLIPPFVMQFAFFVFIFLMSKIFNLINIIVAYKVKLIDVILLLVYYTPFLLQYVIPISVIMSIAIVIMESDNDNEIVALTSNGISSFKLLPPILYFIFFAFIINLVVCTHVTSWGEHNARLLIQNIMEKSFNLNLKAKSFNNKFEGLTFYVDKKEKNNNTLENIFFEESRLNDKNIIIAKEGAILKKKDILSFSFKLFDGLINHINKNSSINHIIKFDSFDMELNFAPKFLSLKGEKKDTRELSLNEYKEKFKELSTDSYRYKQMKINYYNKFSLPASCISLGLLIFALSLLKKKGHKNHALLYAFLAFISYYIVALESASLAKTGIIDPFIGSWFPNVLTIFAAFYFLRKVEKI